MYFRKDLFCPHCDWCPKGYRTSEDGNSCVPRPVPKCKFGYIHTPDQLGCMPRCRSNQELTKDGKGCLIRCGDNETRSEDGRTCIIKCGKNEINTPDGQGCMYMA